MKYICMISKVLCGAFLLIHCVSCKKFLDIGNPDTQIVANYVYDSDVSAAAVLTGIYYNLAQDGGLSDGQTGISFRCALYADELSALIPVYGCTDEYLNASSPAFWSGLYNIIYRANAAIEGINKAQLISSNVKKQLLGEAKFVRAFCYFYLTNFYGDVPLLLTSDYKTNSVATRSPQGDVYKQIILDLEDAKALLSDVFVGNDAISVSDNRTRPTKWAAISLLARTYLYKNDWKKAEDECSYVINNKQLFDTVPLQNVFLKNGLESVWQLQPIDEYTGHLNTADARIFVLVEGVNSQNPVWLSEWLTKKFEVGDRRRIAWIGQDSRNGKNYEYAYKYKHYSKDDPSLEYITVFRIAEQYLIRAEARARLGELDGARSDLNLIRKRAGLGEDFSSNQQLLIASIMHERQVELFTEWGHRWLDLKRVGEANNVMKDVTPQKGGIWANYKLLFSLPLEDLRLNPNLKQNEGYPRS